MNTLTAANTRPSLFHRLTCLLALFVGTIPFAAAAPFAVVENVNNSLDFFPNDPGMPFVSLGLQTYRVL